MVNVNCHLVLYCLAVVFVSYSFAHQDDEEFKIVIISGHTDNCYNGKKTERGNKIVVHYTGILKKDGKKFDSSHDRDTPFRFKLGAGDVIRGWDKGLLGMCIGEKRELTIPHSMAYGAKGAGGVIPPKATLIFHIELIDIEEPEDTDKLNDKNVFKVMDINEDKEITRNEISDYVRLQVKSTKIGAIADDLHNKMVDDILNGQDKDKDGKISFDEFTGQKHDEL